MRTLIVDDEPLARKKIMRYLSDESDVEIVGECGDGRQALLDVQRLAPDLLFLDVQMPELDGFGVLKALGAERTPLVIFVTAYDRFAVRAFEMNALDYLVKPFSRERFRKSLARARCQLQHARKSRPTSPTSFPG